MRIALDDVRRVLVIRRRALGDALVTLPVVQVLREALPDAHLDLVIDRGIARLFENVAGISVLAWDRGVSPIERLRAIRRGRYDLVIDYLSTPQTALLTALSGARLRVGYDLRWRSWAYNLPVARRTGRGLLSQFAGESFADPLRRLGLRPPPWRAGLDFGFGDADLGAGYRDWRGRVTTPGRPLIGLVLSATWPAKAWPLEQAADLIRRLSAREMRTVLLPGPGEAAALAPLRDASPDLLWAPDTDLRELADLLGRLDAVVSTDSGPRHLAAAVGTPTVTLYGPTDPAGWNPEHPLHVALRTDEPCSPCDLAACPVPGHPCLDDLGAETVAEAVSATLARKADQRSV